MDLPKKELIFGKSNDSQSSLQNSDIASPFKIFRVHAVMYIKNAMWRGERKRRELEALMEHISNKNSHIKLQEAIEWWINVIVPMRLLIALEPLEDDFSYPRLTDKWSGITIEWVSGPCVQRPMQWWNGGSTTEYTDLVMWVKSKSSIPFEGAFIQAFLYIYY